MFNKYLKKINILEKILLVLFLLIIVRVLTYRLHLIDMINGININFLLVSIFSNLFLIDLIYRIFKKSNIKITKKEWIILIIISLVIIGLSSYEILSRHMLYYQDNAVYYSKQIALRNIFMTNGMVTTFLQIIDDIWYSDYGCFLNLFLELTNAFTNKSADSYVIATLILIIPYLLVSIYGFIKYVFNKKNKTLYVLLSAILLMPLIYCNLLEGMPDVFGLVFISLIIILTINYDFKEIDIERLILLSIITFFLIICRRWYLYFIISYYILYIVLLLVPLLIKKDYKTLKIVLLNGLKYALIYGIILVAMLFPMIKKIIDANYSVSYVAYKVGNILYDFNNQLHTYGLCITVLSLIGYILLLKKDNREYLKYIILLPVFFLTAILFNTVQNLGVHHLLMMLPSLLFGLLVLISYLENKKYYIPLTIVLILILVNFIYSIDNKLKNNILFTNISLISERRSDISEVKELSHWIIDNTSDKKIAYMIPHGAIYNPDIFKFALAPNIISYDNLPYGSAMLGSHAFPVELFYADYILTSVPFTGYSISYKYDEAFMNNPHFNERFKLIKEYDMHNGYIFKIYEKVSEVTLDEINYYMNYFKEENEKYPDLYGKVIEEYLNSNLGKEVSYE